MKRFVVPALLVLLFAPGVPAWGAQVAALSGTAAAATPNDATTRSAQSGDVFKRMVRVNASLRSYKADLHVDVALKSFLTLNQSLDGNVYYKQPNEQAVVFEVAPALASQFKKLYARIEPPERWAAVYKFAMLTDENGVTVFRLVPRKHGRVSHLDVKVDDATGTIRNYVWNYEDGGFIAFDQSFTTINGNYLVNGQVGHVDLPSYKADVKSSLTNYRLNVAIDNGVFQTSD
jgi:outer membrane lipoprotein-sorting protein